MAEEVLDARTLEHSNIQTFKHSNNDDASRAARRRVT